MKHFSACVLTAFIVTTGNIANAGNITYYDNKSLWIADANSDGGYLTETFAGKKVNNKNLTYTSVADSGVIGGSGAFFAYVATPQNETSSPAGNDYTTWNFYQPISYFGADFNLENPGGPGTGLQIVLDWQGGKTGTWLMEIDRLTGNKDVFNELEFWGFFSTTTFSSLTIMAGSQDLNDESGDGFYSFAERYTMNNVVYTTIDSPPNPVPEPATMVLLGVGIAGLVGIRRRKN